MTRLSACAALVVALSLSGAAMAAPTSADADRQAARAFAEGTKAYDHGDFRVAGQQFETAYGLKPHHAVLWNAAKSWQRAGEDIHAAPLLDEYLRTAPADAPNRDEATAALADVNKRLARVQLQAVVVEELKLDDKHVTGMTTWLPPGEHIASGMAEGGVPVRKLFTVRAGELITVTLTAPKTQPTDPEPAPAPPPEAPAHHDRKPLSPWVVYLGGALAVAGGGIAVWSGFDTLNKRDTFLASPSQRALDEGNASQNRTNVIVGVTTGVAVLTLAVALFLVEWRSDQRRAATLY